jgi:hypothetical protein
MTYIVLCRYIGDDPDLRDNAARYPNGRTMPGTYPDKASADAEAVRHNSKPYTPYFYYAAAAYEAKKAAETERNTCQTALAIIAGRPDATQKANSIEIRRKIAAPGQLSDGTRAFIVAPCERFRYVSVTLGWDTLAEFDQRNFGFDAAGMAAAIIDAIDLLAAARTEKRPTAYREEPTAAGIQLCIPGTERRPVENGKPAQLSLWS